MTRVVCVGDVMVDVVASLAGELVRGSDAPATITLCGGGSAANTAAWLASLGVNVMFVGRVGDDELGRRATDELSASGVDVAVTVDPALGTGMCIVLVDATGERTMVPAAGANAVGGVVPPFGRDDHLHVSGYALFHPVSAAAALAALAAARDAGATVSVDAASAAPLRVAGPDAVLDSVGSVLMFANTDEAAVLTGLSEPSAGARALGARCGEAVVKCGADGAFWSDGTDVVQVQGTAHEPLDSTGAGDAFAAGVLAARVRGGDVRAALRAGNDLAARAVLQRGARPRPRPRRQDERE